MSDTDDTDELLLIPPNVIETDILVGTQDNFAPYYNIVDNLISQVYKLKSRINYIENNSDISVRTNSLESLYNMRSSGTSCRRCYSFESLPKHTEQTDNLCQTLDPPFSTQSTPIKPSSKSMLKSSPNTPSGDNNKVSFKPIRRKLDLSSITNHESHETKDSLDDKNILTEIDNFLKNVKSIKQNTSIRCLQTELSQMELDSLGTQNKVLEDVKQILKEIDQQQFKIGNMCHEVPAISAESMTALCLDRKDPSLKSVAASCNLSVSHSLSPNKKLEIDDLIVSKMSENKSCSQTKSDLHLQEQPQCSLQYNAEETIKTQEGPLQDSMSSENNSDILKDFKKSLNTPFISASALLRNARELHINAQEVLSKHKKLLNESSSNGNCSNLVELVSSKKVIKNWSESDLGTVSLVDLWGQHHSAPERDADKCKQKLQEEKLRRTHCEELIQELQNRILELQEKLAVAIQVDEAKDTAIMRFHDAWERVSMRFKLVCKEKEELEKEMGNFYSQFQQTTDEAAEKVTFYEKEASKALNLAHGNQEKLNELENRCEDLTNQVHVMEVTIKDLQKDFGNEIDKNRQLSTILTNKELELNEAKNVLTHAKKEIAQSKTAVEICQRDFATVKIEYDLVQQELKNQRSVVNQLHEQNKNLFQEIDEQKSHEENLNTTIKELRDKMENNKMELRSFYQGQVELLVQNKLKEFQKQLDESERNMKEDMSRRELDIAKSAASHIQQLTEKYTLEIKLLEEKHAEETRLHEVRTAQLEQRLKEVNQKFDRQLNRRSLITKQLQKIMETQWTEALRIINNTQSPVPQPDSSTTTLEQLHSLQSKSYQNIESILSLESIEEHGSKDVDKNQELNHRLLTRATGEMNKNENLVCNQNTITPLTSRSKRQKPDLQNYINMLLKKEPGNPIGLSKYDSSKPTSNCVPSDRSSRHPPVSAQDNQFYLNDNSNSGTIWKVPWK